MPDMFSDVVTLDEQIAEVEREVAMRRSVYPRWVDAGKLKVARAERQIEVMNAVLSTLRGMKG